MSAFNEQVLEGLLENARSLGPLLQASMQQTFANQAHYKWEGLLPIEQSIKGLLVQINRESLRMISMVGNSAGLYSSLRNPAEFSKNAQILKRDLQSYSQRLAEIHSKHQNKQGVVRGGAQVALFIGVWESYIEWTQSFCDVVLPLFSAVYEDIAHVERQLTNQPS